MPIATAADLLEAVRQTRVLDVRQLEEAAELAPQFSDLHAFAAELVRRGWLTSWQCDQINMGRGAELVLEPYILMSVVGEGGMGQVFKARHRRLKRLAAVKVIRPQYLTSYLAVQRFLQEAEAAAALDHPNMVRVYDAGEVGAVDYLAMEFIEGTDLAKLVKDLVPLSVGQACDYIRQAALGLQHAHEKGLVHRDIKPSNLMLASTGIIKVMDMGLARLDRATATDSPGAGLTGTGQAIGTPDFIAPEQALNAKAVDIRADIYSLGCSLYFLLTGRMPFTGESLTEKLIKHQLEEARAVEGLRRGLPPKLALVVRKMMAKDPGARYATPAEVAQVLEPFVQAGDGGVKEATATIKWAAVNSVAPGPGPRAEPATVATTVAEGERVDGRVATRLGALCPWAFRRPGLASAISCLVLALLLLLISLPFMTGKPEGVSLEREPSARPQDNAGNLESVVLDLGGGVKLELLRIKAGSFRMGSPDSDKEADRNERPQHEVTISRDFYMGKYPVTHAQFAQFLMDSGGKSEAEADCQGGWGYNADHNTLEERNPRYNWRNAGFAQTDQQPVMNVTWNDAQAFCTWARRKTGKRVELPREAEWEYACRAGTKTRYFTGDDPGSLKGYANVGDAALKAMRIRGLEGLSYFAFDDGYPFTSPVGRLQANPWGLYDMTGNVWQWCADAYGEYSTEAVTDPQGPAAREGSNRVGRGGSWYSDPRSCRSACRRKYGPARRVNDLGFRVAVFVR